MERCRQPGVATVKIAKQVGTRLTKGPIIGSNSRSSKTIVELAGSISSHLLSWLSIASTQEGA